MTTPSPGSASAENPGWPRRPGTIIFAVVLLAFAALIEDRATVGAYAGFAIVLSAVGLTLLYTRPSRDFYTGVAMWRAYRRG